VAKPTPYTNPELSEVAKPAEIRPVRKITALGVTPVNSLSVYVCFPVDDGESR